MKIIGLTGSIGMGKTTAAKALGRMGLPCFDADAEVHRLLGPGGAAVEPVMAAFGHELPGLRAEDGGVRRRLLSELVAAEPAVLGRIEAILHPLVHRAEQRFLRQAARQRRGIVVLDIPLLLEKNRGRRCDTVVLLTAPAFLQTQRVMARPGMTAARLAAMRASQWPPARKRLDADWEVPTGAGLGSSLRRLKRVVMITRTKRGGVWPYRPGRRQINPGRGLWMGKGVAWSVLKKTV